MIVIDIKSCFFFFSQFSTSERYVLTAGYPPKDIDKFDETLVEAGLLNAAITLKKV
jgi:hypothetical protein